MIVLPDHEVHVWRQVWRATAAPRHAMVMRSRAFLRRVLRAYRPAGAPLPIEREASARPVLADAHRERLYFSLSRCETMVIVAVGREAELGVDIERIDPALHWRPAARLYLARDEVSQLAELPDASAAAGFIKCWTSREAYLKARGTGWHAEAKAFTVCADPSRPPKLQCGLAPDTAASEWSLRRIATPADHYAVLAHRGPLRRVRYLDAYRPAVRGA